MIKVIKFNMEKIRFITQYPYKYCNMFRRHTKGVYRNILNR